jgi:hypothetical protein
VTLHTDGEPPDPPPSPWRWVVALALAAVALGAGWLVGQNEKNDPLAKKDASVETAAPEKSPAPAAAAREPGVAAAPAPLPAMPVPARPSAPAPAASKGVRLDAAVDVVHKHAVGSCEGRLSATLAGLRYDTAHADDVFAIPLDGLESFGLDYPKKNLRVKARGGRTWNFTTKAPSADPLYAFEHEVTAALATRAKPRVTPAR